MYITSSRPWPKKQSGGKTTYLCQKQNRLNQRIYNFFNQDKIAIQTHTFSRDGPDFLHMEPRFSSIVVSEGAADFTITEPGFANYRLMISCY